MSIEEKAERFLYDLGGWSEGRVMDRRRERLYALLDDARASARIDVETLAAAMYAAVNSNRRWEDESIEAQAAAIAQFYENNALPEIEEPEVPSGGPD